MGRTVAIGALALILGSVAACGGEDAMTVEGDFVTPLTDTGMGDGTNCGFGSGKFGDVRPEAAVRVTAPGGSVYVGKLQRGRVSEGYCLFHFRVDGVPKGKDGQYEVRIEDHKPSLATSDELADGPAFPLLA